MAEHLATGWEPDLDVGDSLLRREVFNLAARYRFCAQRAEVDHVDDEDLVGVRLSATTPWGNDAVLLRPIGHDEAGALVERLHRLVSWPSLLWSAWPTPDMRPYGLEMFGHPPWMLHAPGREPPPDPEGVRIVEVDSDEGMADYDHTVIHGFPLMHSDGTYVDSVLRADFRKGPWRFFVGYVDERPASVASVFVAEGLAQVEWVATLPEFRGRGIGEAVTWRATLAEPDVPAVLIASDMGRPIYERMGYLPVQRFTLWYWKGGTEEA